MYPKLLNAPSHEYAHDESDDKLKRIGHSLSNFDSVECGCE